MLSKNDENHIKLLYEQYFKINSYIKELINNEDIENIEAVLSDKNNLLNKIISFEKSRIADIKNNPLLHTTRLRLIAMETENFNLILALKNNMTQEMSHVKKAKKILNAYEPSLSNSHSTVEYTEGEE